MLKRKRSSLKLPKEYRKRFSKPYDKFIIALLTLADDFTTELIRDCSSNRGKGIKNWMVVLNSEDAAEFRRRKLEIIPDATNPQFVDALLLCTP
jgi:hypothetical protein